MPSSAKKGGTSGSGAEASRTSERMAGKRKRQDEDEERLEREAEDVDPLPTKKAKTGNTKAKPKATRPKKATAKKPRAQKKLKGSASQATTSKSNDSALNEAKKRFQPGTLVYARAGGLGDWIEGQVASVYSIRGTVTVNWHPRLDDGKISTEKTHADVVRNVQTADEYLAGLTEESGSGKSD